MVLEALEVRGFRNIEQITLRPGKAVNIIYGDNAQGKTNLIEALYLLSGQKSFRTAREADLVGFGREQAVISAQFFSGGRSQTAVLTLGAHKSAALGGIPVQPSELVGNFLAVVFSPGELSLVQDGPAERRAFLDSAIAQVMPRYLSTMNTLSRILQQRNNLLFSIAKGYADEGQLEVWDKSLARCAWSVVNARRRFLARLSPPAAALFHAIGGEALSVDYTATLRPETPWGALTPETALPQIEQALLLAREEDLRNTCTTVGPHRDDLDIRINDVSARLYGSQGQQRSCALALKLAQCRVIEETLGEAPLVLLDDVLSELDKSRRAFLLSGLSPGQVFITTCDRGVVRSLPGGTLFRIRGGALAAVRQKTPKPPKNSD